jgi:hypothetical protein
MLGTGADAEAATAAGVSIRGVGDLHAMDAQLESVQQRQVRIVGCIDSAQLKDSLGTDPHTVSLTLTAPEINDRFELAGRLAALRAWFRPAHWRPANVCTRASAR